MNADLDGGRVVRKIIMYNPSICTSNIGDEIIHTFCKIEVEGLFPNDSIINFPTQMPISMKIQKRFHDADIKLICGSNLLQSNMFIKLTKKGLATHAIRQWDISLFNAKRIGPCILLGCGWQSYGKGANLYTKTLWRTVLSNKIAHSVRDSYTEKMLKSIGINNVINTGCPTTWSLTEDLCGSIPRKKSRVVVSTITDYRPDIETDSKMLTTLLGSYDKVNLWLQGVEDYAYFEQFPNRIKNAITLIPPQLSAYSKLLESDVDYVGTRLHGGIYALTRRHRAIIVGVDNRAVEMQKDINLPVVRRNEMDKLDDMIQREWSTEILIPKGKIEDFKSQFR